MQSTEKLCLSKEEQWIRKAGVALEQQGKEKQWKCEAKKGIGYALHREAMDTQGDDTAKPGYARTSIEKKWRSVDGTGSGTAK